MRKILISGEEWTVVNRPLELYPKKNKRAGKIKSSIDFEQLAKRLAGIK